MANVYPTLFGRPAVLYIHFPLLNIFGVTIIGVKFYKLRIFI